MSKYPHPIISILTLTLALSACGGGGSGGDTPAGNSSIASSSTVQSSVASSPTQSSENANSSAIQSSDNAVTSSAAQSSADVSSAAQSSGDADQSSSSQGNTSSNGGVIHSSQSSDNASAGNSSSAAQISSASSISSVSSSTVSSASSSSVPADCSLGCVITLNSNTLRATVTQGTIVDIHYRVNNGGQQNVRMQLNDGIWHYDISNLNSSDVVSIQFTIITSAGQTTPWKDYTLDGAVSSSSVSSSSLSSRASSVNSSVASSLASSRRSSSSRSSVSSVPLGDIVPLYNDSTDLEPEIQFDRGDALVTRFSDRARDRHAKESQFQAYDHYLSFYWEHRTASIEIVDYVAKGGTEVRMNVRTQWRLNDTEAENRWFYRGVGTVAEYFDNGTMEEVDALNYYKVRTHNAREGRAIQIGDKLEFELSQFLHPSVPNGRAAYYGTTFLYIVGEGIVPWSVAAGAVGHWGGSKDSVKIPEEAWLGGKTTLHEASSNEPHNHFMQIANNLGYDNGQPFVMGRRLHHTSFVNGTHDERPVENPVFTEMVGKTGPRYMNDSCANCHVRNGRAAPAAVGQALSKWVFRVADADGNPHPDLGNTLQPRTTGGAPSEGNVSIASWTEIDGLRSPNYQFSGVTPEYFSARIAPQLVGIGLLEAIPEQAILALADPDDSDGDGISGRAHHVTDPVTNETRLGRFGWKANTTSVKHQVASAFNNDMGVMTSVFPTPDCGSSQIDCAAGNAPLADEHLDNLVKYISLLGVRPQRDHNDAAVQRGKDLFSQVGCAGCHTPSFQTSEFHPLAELRDQTIQPYTDLLLHDMGPGLADNLGEGQASGSEWRTAPLWGLGLSACVTGGVVNTIGGEGNNVCVPVHNYLHDGRARSIEEAILWHGGEGEASRNAYQALPSGQKEDVLSFLRSL